MATYRWLTTMHATDIRPSATAVYWLPIGLRMPLKFGPETVTEVTCARVRMTVEDRAGRRESGWGETPLAVQWAWPCALAYEERSAAMQAFCLLLARELAEFAGRGHALEVGHEFSETRLHPLLDEFNRTCPIGPMPYLAGLICLSAFDLALHDAFGRLVGRDIYETYTAEYLGRDLAAFIEPAQGAPLSFAGRYPSEFLVARPPTKLRAWHLVGGLDPLEPGELTGGEPHDGYPVVLTDWIATDGLSCLKVKLRGNDAAWDYERLVRVGRIALARQVDWLSADFNCTVTEPAYVDEILDRLRDAEPRIYGAVLYVEQPFPYDLARYRIDAHSTAARKPLFLDESAHDWRYVRLGRELGWSGVALKTCKTQTGAILSLCWAKAHGMPLMVQDLTNPMLAQIPHVRLAAHAGTIAGVETNGMQFYPAASLPEAAVHPGLYRRRAGQLDLSTLAGPGFGYRLEEMRRELPPAAAEFGG